MDVSKGKRQQGGVPFREGGANKEELGQPLVGVAAGGEAELSKKNREIAADGRGFQEREGLANSF